MTPPPCTSPRRPLPAGACDSHAHIFGPPDKFPFAGGGSYDPPEAPYDVYRAMWDAVGMQRGVLVQPAAYLSDHRAARAACARAGGAIKAVGVTTSAITDDELAALHADGVIGFRFIEVTDPAGGGRFKGGVGFGELVKLAPRLKALGMQAHLWADCERLVADAPLLRALGIPLVVDHMGRPRTSDGVDSTTFQQFLAHVQEETFWVKLSVCRVSTQFPNYSDARPFHDALIASNPDKLVWGSDWPHVRLAPQTPDVGRLIDLFDEWIDRDDALRRKIFVENPKHIFGFN